VNTRATSRYNEQTRKSVLHSGGPICRELQSGIPLVTAFASAASGADRILLAQSARPTLVPAPQLLPRTAASATCTPGLRAAAARLQAILQ
jgi:hypothetical protein